MLSSFFSFFFFNDTATTEIYTLSLHDALPILKRQGYSPERMLEAYPSLNLAQVYAALSYSYEHPEEIEASFEQDRAWERSEEHTSELQSHLNLVCRLLLEKKKTDYTSS